MIESNTSKQLKFRSYQLSLKTCVKEHTVSETHNHSVTCIKLHLNFAPVNVIVMYCLANRVEEGNNALLYALFLCFISTGFCFSACMSMWDQLLVCVCVSEGGGGGDK